MIKQIPNYIFHLVEGWIKQNFQVPIQLQQHFYKRRFEVLKFEVEPRHLCQLCAQCCLLPSDCSPKKVVGIHWSSFLLIWANSYYSIPKPVFFGYFGEASPTQKKPFGGDQPAENGRWNLPRVMVQKVCKPNSEAWFNLLFYKHYFWWLVRRSSSLGV